MLTRVPEIAVSDGKASMIRRGVPVWDVFAIGNAWGFKALLHYWGEYLKNHLSWLCVYRWDLTAAGEPGLQNTPFSASPITTCTDIPFIQRFSFSFSATSSLLSLDDSRGLRTRSYKTKECSEPRAGTASIPGSSWLGQPARCLKSSRHLLTTLYLLIDLSDYIQILHWSQNFPLLGSFV